MALRGSADGAAAPLTHPKATRALTALFPLWSPSVAGLGDAPLGEG